MIKYKFKETDDWTVLTPTIFPDNSSQVWKLKIPDPDLYYKFIMKWNFESEAEIIQFAQLVKLVSASEVFLELPYFPYARQDKKISNNTTFAKKVFTDFLAQLFPYEKGQSAFGYNYRGNSLTVTSYDVHSETSIGGNVTFKNKRPDHFIEAIKDFKPDSIFFPDEGAMVRYQQQFLDSPEFSMLPKMYGKKVRNQLTGEITGYELVTLKDYHDDERVLILDDICDGGATFINAAKELQKINVKDIGLCVSHGIFSKFLTPLWNAGISKVYTTDSYPTKTALVEPNDPGFVVYKV